MSAGLISLIDFRAGATPAEKAALVERVRQLSALASRTAASFVASDLPPNRNGGDVILRLEFASEADCAALLASAEWQEADAGLRSEPGLGGIETLTFTPTVFGERGEEQRGGLYRLLVLALAEGTPAALRERFEAEMAAMPDHVGTILRWNFGRVTRSGSRHRWDYVWEQEFADLAGFRGEYMLHPYHWGVIDPWFDSENPVRIVQPYVCNSFSAIDAPVMFTRWPRPAAVKFGE